jgi:hypothetical protein
MTEVPDRELASRCLTRAKADVETWLALLEQGQFATVAPFGQMFIYQLKMRDKLADRAFAIDELYRLYYRRADGEGVIPVPVDLLRGIV